VVNGYWFLFVDQGAARKGAPKGEEMIQTDFKNIMIVKLRTLGDILTVFPLIRALKERFPEARLHMLADETYQNLFAAHPRIDRFWPHPVKALKEKGAWYGFQHQWHMSRALREAGIDLYIDLYGSLRTALWGAWAGIPVRMGFNLRGRRYFYTHKITASHRYVVKLNLQFAQTLGWTGDNSALEFFITLEDARQARQQLLRQGLKEGELYVVISPAGGWPLKCWSAERFGQLGRQLAQRTGCRLVLSGTPAEMSLIQTCGQASGLPCLTAVGLPLGQLAAVIQGSRLFIGNDSGPKYFAEAFGIPTLICYGPTDFVNNNPDTPRNQVAYQEVACRPCHSEICKMPRRACLDDLTVEKTLELALKLWSNEIRRNDL
jgi:ADP-heptose:LPS heptosyltransferase